MSKSSVETEAESTSSVETGAEITSSVEIGAESTSSVEIGAESTSSVETTTSSKLSTLPMTFFEASWTALSTDSSFVVEQTILVECLHIHLLCQSIQQELLSFKLPFADG